MIVIGHDSVGSVILQPCNDERLRIYVTPSLLVAAETRDELQSSRPSCSRFPGAGTTTRSNSISQAINHIANSGAYKLSLWANVNVGPPLRRPGSYWDPYVPQW